MSTSLSSGSAQPTIDDSYETTSNQVTKEPVEQREAELKREPAQGDKIISNRTATDQTSSNAMPSSLGQGIHGAPPGEESKGYSQEDVGRNQELDAEQMAAPGEGDVYEAVAGDRGKSGASGNQPGLESDLDRKKEEQRGDRERVKSQRERKIDVGGVLGQSEAPADPSEEKMGR